MLHKNPNAYFYRHNVPGEDTWHGEWAAEELERFVEARVRQGLPSDDLHARPAHCNSRGRCRPLQVATTHGCGDKWGLFASYIPHRVGYQCSAAYRHILIPRVSHRILHGHTEIEHFSPAALRSTDRPRSVTGPSA